MTSLPVLCRNHECYSACCMTLLIDCCPERDSNCQAYLFHFEKLLTELILHCRRILSISDGQNVFDAQRRQLSKSRECLLTKVQKGFAVSCEECKLTNISQVKNQRQSCPHLCLSASIATAATRLMLSLVSPTNLLTHKRERGGGGGGTHLSQCLVVEAAEESFCLFFWKRIVLPYRQIFLFLSTMLCGQIFWHF